MEFHSLPNIFTFFLIFLHVSYAFPSSAATPEILAKLRQQAIQQRVKRDASPISVTGDHAFVPPDFSKGDQRGPCPGLNALANHNYIPHNGVASLSEVVSAAGEVYNMGIDLATVIAAMAVIEVGTPMSYDPGFSIGGSSDKSNMLDNLGGLLGTPRGLEGSHNFIEADASFTRDDLYSTGNSWTMNMDMFKDVYDSSATDHFTFEQTGQTMVDIFERSKAKNPYFYYGPFTGLIVRNSGYAFACCLMSNHTAENPDGILTKDIFKSFWGVTGDEGSFSYHEGWERIPENLYMRSAPYGLAELNADLVAWFTQYPTLMSVGGNTGTTNSFVGLDMSNMTSGVLNAPSLLEGDNLVCFGLEIIKTFAPASLSGIFSTIAVPLGLLLDAIGTPLVSLACPAFKDLEADGKPLWEALQDRYPGAARSGSSF